MKKWKIKVAVVLISLCQGLQYTVTPVLNQIHSYYETIPTSLVQTLVTAPALTSIVMALISGWLVTRISKKKLVLTGSLFMGAMGLLPVLSNNFWLLFASRIMMGIGMGLIMALSTAVIAEHFEGAERSAAMGIQGASAGAGVLLASSLGGLVGKADFRAVYLIHLLAFVMMAGLAYCLPETGKTRLQENEELKINGRVLRLCILTFLESMFFSAFTTNIALHLVGEESAVTVQAGRLTSVFSFTQILTGMALGFISAHTKRLALPLGVLQCALGGMMLMVSAANPVLLVLGAVFFGISQGLFVPRAMFEVSELVSPASVALASAFLTLGLNIGQFVSPVVLNAAASVFFENAGTREVFEIVAIGGFATALIAAAIRIKENDRQEEI